MNTKNGVEFTQLPDPENNKSRLTNHITGKSMDLKSEKTIAGSAAFVKK